jgi:hypothetical protein
LTSVKGCDVCGGRVQPVSQDSTLGYCVSCGIVYFLRTKSGLEVETESMDVLQNKFGNEQAPRSEVADPPPEQVERAPEPAGSYWMCPDCGTRFALSDQSDAMYIKREHFREFHPNRIEG